MTEEVSGSRSGTVISTMPRSSPACPDASVVGRSFGEGRRRARYRTRLDAYYSISLWQHGKALRWRTTIRQRPRRRPSTDCSSPDGRPRSASPISGAQLAQTWRSTTSACGCSNASHARKFMSVATPPCHRLNGRTRRLVRTRRGPPEHRIPGRQSQSSTPPDSTGSSAAYAEAAMPGLVGVERMVNRNDDAVAATRRPPGTSSMNTGRFADGFRHHTSGRKVSCKPRTDELGAPTGEGFSRRPRPFDADRVPELRQGTGRRRHCARCSAILIANPDGGRRLHRNGWIPASAAQGGPRINRDPPTVSCLITTSGSMSITRTTREGLLGRRRLKRSAASSFFGTAKAGGDLADGPASNRSRFVAAETPSRSSSLDANQRYSVGAGHARLHRNLGKGSAWSGRWRASYLGGGRQDPPPGSKCHHPTRRWPASMVIGHSLPALGVGRS